MSHWTEQIFVEHADVFGETMRQRVEDAEDEVGDLLSLVEEHGVDPANALDVACGIGRHAVELAKAGVEVRGVDISPEYVDAARDRAAEAGVDDAATFEVGDMRDLAAVGGTYDLVTNMWTAFGYFDDDENEAVAKELHDRVADGGVLVMELANKEAMMANFQDSAAGLDDGLLHAERREYTTETSRIESTLTLFREVQDGYDYVGEVGWDLRVYAPAELRRLLERAGFSSVRLYGGLDGTELERESSRLVVVATP